MVSELVEVYTCGGGLEAETYRIFLESRGLQVMVSQESAGSVHGLTVGALGTAHIFVPAEQSQAALAALRAMEKGEYETDAGTVPSRSDKHRWKKKVLKKKPD